MASKVLMAGVGTSLVGGGSLYSYRQSLVAQRRAELAKEHADLTTDMRNCEKQKKAVVAQEKVDFAKIEARQRAVDTLWADRMQRYADTNAQLKSFIIALPEAMGIVNGLANHYRYLSEAAKDYFGFDVWSSKAHNAALLLSNSDNVGLVPVVEHLQGLFSTDAFVETVCSHTLLTAGTVSAPQTVGDVNTAFSFCMEQLDVATLAAAERYEFDRSALHAHKAANVVVAGITRVLVWAKLPEVDPAVADARLAAEARQRRRFRQLTDVEAIHHALRYVEGVSQLIDTQQGRSKTAAASATAAAASSSSAASSGSVLQPGKAPQVADAFVSFSEYALRDAAVVGAVQQLRTWEEGATAYLVQSQAKTVLKAYFDVMALPLTSIRDAPPSEAPPLSLPKK